MTATCWSCPAVLHRQPDLQADEWVWADEAGNRFGTPGDLLHVRPSPRGRATYPDSPEGRLAELSDLLTGVRWKARASLTWLYHQSISEYSSLKVRLDMAGSTHEHHARPQHSSYDGPPPPECCGWPMRLRPSGWHCRQGCGGHRPATAAALAAVCG